MATVFTLLFLGVMLLVCFFRPYMIVAVAMIVYPFEQWAQSNSELFRSHPAAMNVAFGVMSLVAILGVVLRGRNPMMPVTPLAILWGLLMFYAAASCVWSINPTISYFVMTHHFPYIVTFVVLVPLAVQSSEDLRRGLNAAVVLGTMTMLLLLLGTQIHDWGRTIHLAGGGVVNRAGLVEDRLNPLAVADMCGAMLVLAIVLNFTERRHIWTLLRWGVALLAIALMIRSGSRGQIIASLLVIVLLLGASRGYGRHMQVAAAGVVGVLLLGLTFWLFDQYSTTGASRWELETMGQDFAKTRLQKCSIMLVGWLRGLPQAWLFGLGSSAAYDAGLVGTYPHVVVVEVLTELGFVGLALFSSFMAVLAWNLRQSWLAVRGDTLQRGLVTAVAGLCLFDFILTFKQGSLLMHTWLFMYALLAARLWVFVQQEQAQKQARWRVFQLQRLRWWDWRRALLQNS